MLFARVPLLWHYNSSEKWGNSSKWNSELRCEVLGRQRSVEGLILNHKQNKGGEGKTTNSIVLAEYLALIANKRVLSIDLDPQANFSGRYIQMAYDPAYQ